jgi:hypothetical protein
LVAEVPQGRDVGKEVVVAGGGECGPVVGLARNRCRDREQAASEVGQDLHVQPGSVAFAGEVGQMGGQVGGQVGGSVSDWDEGAVHEHDPSAQDFG